MLELQLHLLQQQEQLSGLLFKVETNNNTHNLKNTINAHADFSATVSSAVVTVTRAAVGNDNLTVTSSDTTRLTATILLMVLH